MRITKQVYLVGGGNYGLSHPGDCNIFLVDCGSTRVLIDAGCGMYPEGIIDNIKSDGFDPMSVDTIVCTHSHWDHACGCSALKTTLKATIAGHPACEAELNDGLWTTAYAQVQGARPAEPTNLDIALEHGQQVKWGDVQFEVIHTPGHTPDSICLCANTIDRRILFTGDTILGEGTLGTCSVHTDFPKLLHSMEALSEYGVDALFPGHRTFSLRYGLEQIANVKHLLSGMWASIVPGPTAFFPTWWIGQRPELIQRNQANRPPFDD